MSNPSDDEDLCWNVLLILIYIIIAGFLARNFYYDLGMNIFLAALLAAFWPFTLLLGAVVAIDHLLFSLF